MKVFLDTQVEGNLDESSQFSVFVSYLGNTVSGLGQEAELQDSRCQGQQGQEELEPVSALTQILSTLSSHEPQFSEQDEESSDEKKNLKHRLFFKFVTSEYMYCSYFII